MNDILTKVLEIIVWVGALQSLFLAVYVLTVKNERHRDSILPAMLFIVLSLRVAKSALWAYWDATPLWVLNLGFAAHACIGPLFFLYVFALSRPERQLNWLAWTHFIPAALILAGIQKLTLSEFWYAGWYTALLIQNIMYVIAGFIIIWQYRRDQAFPFSWLIRLQIGITLFSLSYFSNFIFGLTSYLAGPVLYAGSVYVITFYALRQRPVFLNLPAAKYKNLNITESMAKAYCDRLTAIMQSQKPYFDSAFNLPRLSELSSLPSHVISYSLNTILKQNFTEFVNAFRIKEAQSLLVDPKSQSDKIVSIAYDCGFNSLSSFNTAFKKITKITPSEFRLRHANFSNS
ncbi:helix-turn-helix domain-containing protein [bacterium]|nr:helix-turn-helix domain-containing protein [bacterium]